MVNGRVTQNCLADIAGKTRKQRTREGRELLTVARRMGVSPLRIFLNASALPEHFSGKIF